MNMQTKVHVDVWPQFHSKIEKIEEKNILQTRYRTTDEKTDIIIILSKVGHSAHQHKCSSFTHSSKYILFIFDYFCKIVTRFL